MWEEESELHRVSYNKRERKRERDTRGWELQAMTRVTRTAGLGICGPRAGQQQLNTSLPLPPR